MVRNEREKDLKIESERIINTAEKLILSDIRSINLESDIPWRMKYLI